MLAYEEKPIIAEEAQVTVIEVLNKIKYLIPGPKFNQQEAGLYRRFSVDAVSILGDYSTSPHLLSIRNNRNIVSTVNKVSRYLFHCCLYSKQDVVEFVSNENLILETICNWQYSRQFLG
jgi:hypothetical protein